MDDRYTPYGRPHSPYEDGRAARRGHGGLTMNVTMSPSDAHALSNLVTIAPGQLDPKDHYILVNGNFVFTVR